MQLSCLLTKISPVFLFTIYYVCMCILTLYLNAFWGLHNCMSLCLFTVLYSVILYFVLV